MQLTLLPIKLTGLESVRYETDQLVTGQCRSCVKMADSGPWPVDQCISNWKQRNKQP